MVVSELTAEGFLVATFVAEDVDSGINGQVILSIAEVKSERVGKEKYQFTVTVSVSDLGNPSKNATSMIVVNGCAVCKGSTFIMDQSTLQLRILALGYFLDEGLYIESCT